MIAEIGRTINERMDIEEVAVELSKQGKVFHKNGSEKTIYRLEHLEKHPKYNFNIDILACAIDESCCAIEIPTNVLNFFEIHFKFNRSIFILQQTKAITDQTLEEHFNAREIRLYSVCDDNESSLFLLPKSKPLDMKLEFTIKDAKVNILEGLNELKYLFAYLYGFQNTEYQKKNNCIDEINHIVSVFNLLGIQLSYEDGFFIEKFNYFENKLKELQSRYDEYKELKYKRSCPENDDNNCAENEKYYEGIRNENTFVAIKYYIDVLSSLYNEINRILKCSLVQGNEKNEINDKTIIQLLNMIYPVLFLFRTNIVSQKHSNEKVSFLQRKEVRAKIWIEHDCERYRLATNSKLIECISYIDHLLRLTNDISQKTQKKDVLPEDIAFFWKNEADYSLPDSKKQKFLEHGKDYFEFDKDLFIKLHYPSDSALGEEKYYSILESYKYDKDSVMTFEARKVKGDKTEQEVRDGLKKIYSNLKDSEQNLKSVLKEAVDLYLKKLEGKAHVAAYDEVFVKLTENDSTTKKKKVYALLKELNIYADNTGIPYLDVGNSTTQIAQSTLDYIYVKIYKYNEKQRQ